jgi:hypothetical protein
MYIGDFVINLHDRISVTEDAYEDPTVTGTADYARLENAAGISALWDLNKVRLRAGYDHINYISFGRATQPDAASEVFSVSAGYMLQPHVEVGLVLGGALVDYEDSTNSFDSAKQWNVGGYYEAPISEYMRFRVDLGYTVHRPDNAGDLPNHGEFSGLYAQVNLSHRLNQYFQYSLSGGRTIDFDLYGGTVDLYYARLDADWKLFRNITSSISLEYEHGSGAGIGPEPFDRYGAKINFGRPITKKLSARLGYEVYWRIATLSDQDYLVNVVSAGFNYRF